MSMIGVLIDNLNKSADEWNGSNMFELAHMCREAADTITELRGALQVASVDYRHLSEENAKLRELVRALVYAIDPSDRATIICNAAELMDELGVEVDS